jgi:hypothetical protein
VRGKGFYHGISEDSILINVYSNYNVDLRHELERLKRELRQESILVAKSAVEIELI